MIHAYTGKSLRVDLTGERIMEEPTNLDRARTFIGGRGLATRLLFDEIDPTVDPLDERNKLILATGPLTGTTAACAGRFMAITKGPLTGTIACSNAGGNFGPELKYAGYDMIVFEGAARRPVILVIDDGKVELQPADDLWGKNVHQTEDVLHERLGADFKCAVIGPAGEKLVKFACIMTDKNRAAGRSGVGAVMGSKKLKAVAVRGTGGITVADREGFRSACIDALSKLTAGEITGTGLKEFGTAILVNIINEGGMFPTRNAQQGQFEHAEAISGETIAEKILIRPRSCVACPIACGRMTRISDGRFTNNGEGPEYETVWALGADVGVSDLAAVTKANYICNELGMDTITAGATVACAMELFEKGAITKKEAGRTLRFGDAEALVDMMSRIGKREGFGDVLAEGAARVAERFGRPDLFMGVKKQEFPAYDPRGVLGMGVQYATSNRGACHVRGYMIAAEVLGVPEKLDPLTPDGKAAMNIAFQDLTAALDSAGICLFVTFSIGAPELTAMLKTATGFDYDEQSVMLAGERIWNLERLFNQRAGFTRKDDTLPRRMLTEPMPDGPAKGKTVPLEAMLEEYYRLRGWNEKGQPTEEKLAALGL
ncbi:MAG: aldehyde ferredoxin oxidoreductase family protein [Phycisphaerales bacterium]|nr:MAG: aldehyde ferredoxin oxidoreductase family protein [Phycisphaerales bacterium]